MKINSVGLNTNSNIDNRKLKNNKQKQTSPNFKGLMDAPGAFMQALEKSGFIGSFLVQDTLGMTVPRTREGLYRDVPKDKRKNMKDWNYKEGAEVLIREGLSGPLLMFAPVAVLALSKKFVGKSTFTNSSLIKRLGKNLTSVVEKGGHDSTKGLKKAFYEQNITKIVQGTTNAADKVAEAKFIDSAVKSVEKLDRYSEKIANSSGKYKRLYKKAQAREQARLIESFNNYHTTHNPEYSLVNKVKFEDSTFATNKMIDGMRGYASDTLKGKNIADITTEYTTKQEKTSLAKRFVTNILAAVSTVGAVSIVPKLYSIINPVPPGSLNNNNVTNTPTVNVANNTPQKQNQNGQVSFTGKWDKLAKHLEFNGSQLTPALMTVIATGGLLGPRINTAVKRAPEHPITKEKDYSEIPEILTRDLISTAAVTFGVPLLSKNIVSSYEHGSGFVLQTKADKPMSTFKKVLDKLNPFGGLAPYSLDDLNAIYGKVDSVEKLGTFSKFIDKNNGSIAKVFNTMEESKGIFSEVGLDIKELAKATDRKTANKTIMDKMANKEFANKLVDLIKPAKDGKANAMLKRARSLNSITSFAATILLVPAFLGIVLPRMVYGLTEKRQKKMAEMIAAANAGQVSVPAPTQPIEQKTTQQTTNVDFSKLKQAAQNKTFGQMKHS